MTDPNIGRILSRRYKLVNLLGQGAMGRVYGAEDKLLGGVPVAVKFLAQTVLNQKMRDRFEREATICALLGHQSAHIVKVNDYGVDEEHGVPYYVMEQLQGESLNDIIHLRPLSLSRFLRLTRQICQGLQCAHKGIPVNSEICPVVHRDIKPNNILVIQDRSLGELAKILDFGIAKTLQADSDQTNCFMGTLAYASPEQMEGKELDERSDIYSLGVMMFQMITGRMPFQVETNSFGSWYQAHHFKPPRSFAEVNADVELPKVLESLVMSCLEKRASDRPNTVAEILRDVERLERQVGQERKLLDERIENALREKPIRSGTSVLTPDEVCRLTTWPSGKPIAEIVFPDSLETSKEMLATLWVMLRQEEIAKRQRCTRFNQFLFIPMPHPTLLWLTVLYNREHGARWLPCYLDLKTTQGQSMTRLLAQAGQYRLLSFAQENPKKCAHVHLLSIAPQQCRYLLEWATTAQMTPPISTFGSSKEAFNLSKEQLKRELESLKPRILMKLESMYNNDQCA